jgi:DNA polymerase III epsilon subunit-like protein
MNHHIMIDLETLGTHQTAPIVTVGLVVFYPTGQDIVDTRAFVLNVDAQAKIGRIAHSDTLEWWLRQDKSAQEKLADALLLGRLIASGNLHTQLLNVASYISLTIGDFGMVWGYGANEDIAWLSGLFDSVGIARPWHYRKVACYRTILREHGATGDDWVAPTVAHDAVADAVAQAKTLQRICARTGRNMEDA